MKNDKLTFFVLKNHEKVLKRSGFVVKTYLKELKLTKVSIKVRQSWI